MANLKRAEALIEKGQLVDAREIVVEALHQNYDNLNAWLLLTTCARDRQELGRALREILRIDPANPQAREMATALAKEAKESKKAARGDSGYDTPRREHHTRPMSPAARMTRFFLNMLGFLVIVGIAGGVAYLYIDWEKDKDNPKAVVVVPTLDSAQKCVESVGQVYARLSARCSLLTDGEACLVNAKTTVESNTGPTDLLALPGDRELLSNLRGLETLSYNEEDGSWGLVLVRGLSSFEEGSGQGLLMAVSSGVRLRFFDTNLQQITFSSNPAPTGCATVPPAGLLISVPTDQSAAMAVNGENFLISGTVFMQVDVAAGLRIVVLEGQVSITDSEHLIVQGQWVKFTVDSSLLTTDVPIEVFETAPNLRGDASTLLPLGQALGLPVENWQLVGLDSMTVITATPDAPTSEASPITTTEAPPTLIELPTTAPTATVTRTPRPSATATLEMVNIPTFTIEPSPTVEEGGTPTIGQ